MVNLGGSGGDENGGGYHDTGDSNGMEGGGKEEEKGLNRVQYTIPGVLHFLQHEWAKFEMEKAQWDVERAELQARISFLQGERKGQENLKNDLVRRIKMLEFALKQERMKHAPKRNPDEADSEAQSIDITHDEGVPTDVDAVSSQPNSNYSWRQGRQLLRQYLEEMGYSDRVINLRTMRTRSLLGLMNNQQPPNNKSDIPASMVGKSLFEAKQAVMETAEFLDRNMGRNEDSRLDEDSEDDDDESAMEQFKSSLRSDLRQENKDDDLGLEEEKALAEFEFLAGDGSGEEGKKGDPSWGVDYAALSKMKEEYRREAKNKKRSSTDGSAIARILDNVTDGDPVFQQNYGESGSNRNSEGGRKEGEQSPGSHIPGLLELEGNAADIEAVLGLTTGPGETDDIDPATFDVNLNSEESLRKTWSCRHTLRSHYDGIRAMSFHPVEPVLLTASEDGTMKLWNLSKAGGKKASPSTADLEPVYTFRGHRGAVLCLCMSPTGDTCYTGGLDGTIRCWSLPSPNNDIYEPYNSKVLQETLEGHKDAVWAIGFHTSDNRLISASADGTLKLWDPGNQQQMLLKSLGMHAGARFPTSVDFVSTEPRHAVVSGEPTAAYILDVETGTQVLGFETDSSMGRIYQIASHPTMPVTVVASEDRMIRYYDNNTGKTIDETVAHLDAVTCLSIDPNGLYLLSGSHDGSLRLWNMENKTCLQEITAHRPKLAESVLSVAFHPSCPLIASGGADSVAKVFV